MQTVDELMDGLRGKDNQVAYACLRTLGARSEASPEVYRRMDALVEMMGSDNSYQRTRGLLLIAANARWDVDNRIDEIIDAFLTHVEDAKPITALQCIQCLPELARYKPELVPDIQRALTEAKTYRYPDTMRSLVRKDIADALRRIDEERAAASGQGDAD